MFGLKDMGPLGQKIYTLSLFLTSRIFSSTVSASFQLYTSFLNCLPCIMIACHLSDEPHEWAYSLGHETTEMEIIDITDGSTGQIHNIAKQHTSIYVNEVGHSNDLHENV